VRRGSQLEHQRWGLPSALLHTRRRNPWRSLAPYSTIPVALTATTDAVSREGEMEEKELLEELRAIRHLVRQTWILAILPVALVAVPAVLLGCLTAGVILVEFLPH